MAKKICETARTVILSNIIFMADAAQAAACKPERDMYLGYAVRRMKKMVKEGGGMPYEHIIFDLDGTLLDTERSVLLAWQSALEKYRYRFSLEELRIVLGITPESALQKLQVTVDGHFWSGWMEAYAAQTQSTAFFDGVTDMLDTLKRRGYRLGIVTSRTREEYERYFRSFRLEQWFERMVCAGDTQKHKPDPEPLYRYAALAGALPQACLYVGDMPTDIACANRAGAASGLAAWNGSGALCAQAKFVFRTPQELCDILAG